MSAQYRDNLNNRSLYSNATTRQHCVSCPSSCSCKLGERSTMDQLMFRAWSKGPSGDPSVFHQSSNACPTCGSNHRHRHHHKENYNEGTSGPALDPGGGVLARGACYYKKNDGHSYCEPKTTINQCSDNAGTPAWSGVSWLKNTPCDNDLCPQGQCEFTLPNSCDNPPAPNSNPGDKGACYWMNKKGPNRGQAQCIGDVAHADCYKRCGDSATSYRWLLDSSCDAQLCEGLCADPGGGTCTAGYECSSGTCTPGGLCSF